MFGIYKNFDSTINPPSEVYYEPQNVLKIVGYNNSPLRLAAFMLSLRGIDWRKVW